jgi:hypothetical protein
VLGACDRAGGGPSQERRSDQGVDDGLTSFPLEAPEPSGLRRRQAQAWHLQEFLADTVHDKFELHGGIGEQDADHAVRSNSMKAMNDFPEEFGQARGNVDRGPNVECFIYV